MIFISYQAYESYESNGFPSHWIEQRVKDIALLERGKFTHRPRNDPQMYGGVHPFIQTGDIARASKYVKTHSQTLSDKGTTVSKFFPKGTLVIAIAANIGDVAIVGFDTYFPDSIVAYKTKKNDTDFLFYLFSAKKHELNKVKITNTQDNLNLERLNSLIRVIPPLEEQKAIAHYLDTKTAQIDRKIDLLTQKAQRYEELKRSLINETVTRGLDKSVPMKDSDNEWGEYLPISWQEPRVKNLFNLITKIAPENNNFELLSLYASIGVRPRKEMEQRGNKAVTTDGYWMVKKGDIIVNKLLAWMGAIGLSEYDGVTSPAYDILRKASDQVDERYYTYLFRTEKAQAIFKRHSRGIMDVRLRLYFDKFGAITVPFPPISEQRKIAHYLDTKTAQTDQIIQTINTQIEKLQELRKTLINDVVTGKIKVIEN